MAERYYRARDEKDYAVSDALRTELLEWGAFPPECGWHPVFESPAHRKARLKTRGSFSPGEEFQNIRRAAERGLAAAQRRNDPEAIDTFQHVLDNWNLALKAASRRAHDPEARGALDDRGDRVVHALGAGPPSGR